MSQYDAETREQSGIRPELDRAYKSRIEWLRGEAEIEGISVNGASESGFWAFVKSIPFARRGDLVLNDNGNFRAIWDNGDGTHLGVQFLEDGMLQYVIFKRRQDAPDVSRVGRIDTPEGVKQQVEAFDIESLWRE